MSGSGLSERAVHIQAVDSVITERKPESRPGRSAEKPHRIHSAFPTLPSANSPHSTSSRRVLAEMYGFPVPDRLRY